MKNRFDVLRLARTKLTPTTWIQGSFANDDKGRSLSPTYSDPPFCVVPGQFAEPVRFCVLGAVYVAAHELGVNDDRALWSLHRTLRLRRRRNRGSDAVLLRRWNDDYGQTFADVLRAFDDTIRRGEANQDQEERRYVDE